MSSPGFWSLLSRRNTPPCHDPPLEISRENKPLGPSARIDAAATRAAEQSERVASIRAALRRMLNDDAQTKRMARAFQGLLKR
jgi:hypothetical protein